MVINSIFLLVFWDVNEHISVFEISARAVVMFLIAFLIIRVVGMRQFRKNSPFDMVITFLIGGVLSRGVVGATPFLSALAGGLALVILQKLFYKVAFQNRRIEKIMKGDRYVIYKEGKFIKENMQKADITTLEVYEDLRADLQAETLEGVGEIYVEKTGEITFVKKEEK